MPVTSSNRYSAVSSSSTSSTSSTNCYNNLNSYASSSSSSFSPTSSLHLSKLINPDYRSMQSLKTPSQQYQIHKQNSHTLYCTYITINYFTTT